MNEKIVGCSLGANQFFWKNTVYRGRWDDSSVFFLPVSVFFKKEGKKKRFYQVLRNKKERSLL